ncbi:MAG: IreB family regulatory phosphoprotein [Firmicutes bacterium]|nr:IreB family regulatory phosphoprotein [Bacillota bacterium]
MDLQDKTRTFSAVDVKKSDIANMIKQVCTALEAKGYRPLDQIVGYLVSGDPSYITSYNDARLMMQKIERNDLLEEIVGAYLEKLG